MLTSAGMDYLRIGSETTCDPRFVHRLLEHLLGERPRLTDMQTLIGQMPIIVATTSMLQARPFLFDVKHFSLCIVDEASQLLEPAIVGTLTKDIDRFILIGDHKQLPAVVQQKDGGGCACSLFERLLKQERQAGRTQFVGILHKQGRMHPDVAEFTNKLFYAREQISPVPLPHQRETALAYSAPAEDALDKVLMLKRVIFIDSTPAASEAQLVADLLRRLRRFLGTDFNPQKSIGVIVPYRIEIGRIRRALERLGIPDMQDITIDTVERYQGSQRDVIIYAFAVDSPTQLPFLTATCFKDDDGCIIDRKLNVAMTRARRQLIMTGRAPILRRNPIFATLIERYHSENDDEN
jgi:superfamily I DNA and/or RNA helicase